MVDTFAAQRNGIKTGQGRRSQFFDDINQKFAPEQVKYDVVDSFGKLMELVK